jgi:phosphohistidine swiveling domain-containing protein
MEKILRLRNLSEKHREVAGSQSLELAGLSEETDIPVQEGLVVTSEFFEKFMRQTGLEDTLVGILDGLDPEDVRDVEMRGRQIRAQIREADMPPGLRREILDGYREFMENMEDGVSEVTLRPSGTTLSSEEASTARNSREIIDALKKCYTSVFTDRYIAEHGQEEIPHLEMAVPVTVHPVIGEDVEASGTVTSFEPLSLNSNILTVTGAYGTGPLYAQDKQSLDRFEVFAENTTVLRRNISRKYTRLVEDASEEGLQREDLDGETGEDACLTHNQVRELANYVREAEESLGKPVEMRWVLDERTRDMSIMAADTVEDLTEPDSVDIHTTEGQGEAIVEGNPAGSGVVSGRARVLSSPHHVDRFDRGDILVADTTDSSWEPLMEEAGAVVTNQGGMEHTDRLCMEIGTPAVTDTEVATSRISDGQKITVHAGQRGGQVLEGDKDYSVSTLNPEEFSEAEAEFTLEVENTREAMNMGSVSGTSLFVDADSFGNQDKLTDSAVARSAASVHPERLIIRLEALSSEEPSLESLESVRNAVENSKVENLSIVLPRCSSLEQAKKLRAQVKRKLSVPVYLEVGGLQEVQKAGELSEIFSGFLVDAGKSRWSHDSGTEMNLVRKLRSRTRDSQILIRTGKESGLPAKLFEEADRVIAEAGHVPHLANDMERRDMSLGTDPGSAAGKVYRALEDSDASTASELVDSTGLDLEEVNMALGWLLREDKVERRDAEDVDVYVLSD